LRRQRRRQDTGSGGQETTKESRQESIQAASEAERYALPGNEVYPEGVAYRPDTGEFFVGSTTDGTVFRGNVGEPGAEAEIFLEPGKDGRTAATGMKVDPEGQLLVAEATPASSSSTTRGLARPSPAFASNRRTR